jgi:hypothetical protein
MVVLTATEVGCRKGRGLIMRCPEDRRGVDTLNAEAVTPLRFWF